MRIIDLIMGSSGAGGSEPSIESLIRCDDCKKSFTQHPRQECCFVKHIHSQILFERFAAEYKASRLSQGENK